MVKPKLISDPSQVTSEWLTDVLRYSGKLTDGMVVNFESSLVPGAGLMCRIIRIKLTYSKPDPNYPQSVILKFPGLNESSLEIGRKVKAFVLEVNFYKEIKPKVGMKTPDIYFVEIDPADDTKFVIFMEDMVPPFLPGDSLAGCTVEEAGVALRELARLHGPLWGDPQLKNYNWLRIRRDPNKLQQEQSEYQSILPVVKQVLSPFLDSPTYEMLERFGESYLKVFALDTPDTVVHGDVRLDNFLIRKESGGVEMAMVDFQTLQVVHGAYDVAYFLCGTLPGDFRKEHELTLLKNYHSELCRCGVENYSFDQLYSDYRRYSMGGAFTLVQAAALIKGLDDRAKQMLASVLSRYASNGRDLGVTDFF
ncbi:MAG: ecdysteroid 22-kinase family protein [Actinobacteria bacterium]|nr:ecdysteroid 22-kinase family protein [Actinomycetota bacterium]